MRFRNSAPASHSILIHTWLQPVIWHRSTAFSWTLGQRVCREKGFLCETLCDLCVSAVKLLRKNPPQRHRARAENHRVRYSARRVNETNLARASLSLTFRQSLVAEQINRAANYRLRCAMPVSVEEILALSFGGPPAFNLQLFRHDRSVQKAGANRRVARLLGFAAICGRQFQGLHAVMMQQDKVAEKR